MRVFIIVFIFYTEREIYNTIRYDTTNISVEKDKEKRGGFRRGVKQSFTDRGISHC